ncbi:MAG: tRNA 2-thiocytidine(32) synthetase TtcA [Ruminococcaceae bacterium]|nr:tRNA 2-thiocytidine(32) synthetase TtcA [Oscillospiraceae bacterium]
MNFERARRLLSFLRRAVDDYEMIQDGDRIAVGISGGKDSMALVCIMNELRRFYPKYFEIVAITVDTGFEGMDFGPLVDFFKEMGIEYIIEKTNIAQVVFDIRKESNPCSLCANMRRGALHNAAVNAGCNKLALGHHFDDVIDTFMLNLIYEGRIGCFSPITYLSNRQISMIRPMIYAKESDIKYFMKTNDIPIVKSTCPEDKHTKREDVKKLIDSIEADNEGFRHRIFTAIQNGNIDGFHPPEKNRRNKF